MRGACACLFVALVATAHAQFGFFDLDSDEGTKFRGNTKNILPNCFSTPNGMCGDSGRTVYTKNGRQSNLFAWYTFDDAYGADHSGNANHGLAPPTDYGPGHDGRGQSAYFSGTTGFTIPTTPELNNLHSMTISFWIYLLTDSTDAWRVIFRKGDQAEALTPSLLLFPDSRRLHFVVSSSDPAKHGVDSVTSIPLRRWTHVAVVYNTITVDLYINGIKDNTGNIAGAVNFNTGNLYIGKDPFMPGTGMYIDDFKIFGSVLTPTEVQAEAANALPGVGPNFLTLGCKQCEIHQAIESCSGHGYHLCRRIELQGAGLMVARAMGYLDMASEHWVAEDSEPEVALRKLGLCCLD